MTDVETPDEEGTAGARAADDRRVADEAAADASRATEEVRDADEAGPADEGDAAGERAAGGAQASDEAGPADEGARSRGGRGRVGLVVSVVVAVVLVGFVAVLATGEPATERRATSPLIGKVTPALAGETIDGGGYDIDDHDGEWVVVNFFATWCLPCVQEHPELIRFSEAHAGRGDASVVSVVYDRTDLDEARDFFAERGGDWPVLAEGRDAALDYGVVKVPETYLVAPGGIVVQKYTGGVTQEMIDNDIAAVEAATQEGS